MLWASWIQPTLSLHCLAHSISISVLFSSLHVCLPKCLWLKFCTWNYMHMIELYWHMMIQIINAVMSSQFGYMHPQIKIFVNSVTGLFSTKLNNLQSITLTMLCSLTNYCHINQLPHYTFRISGILIFFVHWKVNTLDTHFSYLHVSALPGSYHQGVCLLVQAVPSNGPVCKLQTHIRISIKTHIHHLTKC